MVILGAQFFSIGLLGELIIGLISRLERSIQIEKKGSNTSQNEEKN